MIEMNNLFGDITMVTGKNTKKETKADAKKTPAKTEKKKQEKTGKPAKYKLPVTVYYGETPAVIEGEGETNDKELVKKISEIMHIPASLIRFHMIRADAVAAMVIPGGKNVPESGEGWTMVSCCGGFSMEYPAELKEFNEVMDCWCRQYPEYKGGGLALDEETKTAVVTFKRDSLTDKVEYPLAYKFYGGSEYMYAPEGNRKGDTLANFLSGLEKTYKVRLQAHKTDGVYIVFGGENEPAPKKGKRTSFPTEGTTLSLMLRHIPLDPSMFAGKTEVREDELIAWLSSQYPEYSKERTAIEYDEDKKLIIAHLKGASKGTSRRLLDRNEAEEALKDPYALFWTRSNDGIFRNEKNPVGFFG